MLALCDACDGAGLAALSKKTLARQVRASEATVWRALAVLEAGGDIEPADVDDAPLWWTELRADRRPTLFRLVAFTRARESATTGLGPLGHPVDDAVDSNSAGSRRGRVERGRDIATGSRRDPVDQQRRATNLRTRDEPISAASQSTVDEPVADCVSCHGKGTVYNATGGFEARCACTWDPEHNASRGPATRPPVGFGMPAQRSLLSP